MVATVKRSEPMRSVAKPCPCGGIAEPFSKYCVECIESDVFAEWLVEKCCEDAKRGDIY